MDRFTLNDYIARFSDDQYAMEVMYYCLKKSLVKRQLTGMGIHITIGKKYFDKEIQVSLYNTMYDEKRALLLLMSFRAIMLDLEYFDYTNPDGCFLLPDAKNYSWIEYGFIIERLCDDAEFESIYKLLVSSFYDKALSEEDYIGMESDLVHPGYRNAIGYFSEEAAKNPGTVEEEYIGDRAYFCDNDIEEVTVEEPVLYVGNTAFAYCENLRSITFERTDTAFGKFPIVECERLEEIVVPDDAVDYYKDALPYYKDIVRGVNQKYVVNSDLDVSKIDEVFEKKATSYKYLWFWALLSLASENELRRISLESIVIRMVAKAWPLIYTYKLDFGRVDQISKYFDQLYSDTALKKKNDSCEVEEYLIENMGDNIYKIIAPLLKNAPYRFLSPWIPFESVGDVEKKSKLKKYNAPYSISKNCIEIKEVWFNYFMVEAESLQGFILSSFIDYLKQFNTPAKISKAFIAK